MSTLGEGQDMASALMGTVMLETPFASSFLFDPDNDP